MRQKLPYGFYNIFGNHYFSIQVIPVNLVYKFTTTSAGRHNTPVPSDGNHF